MKILMVCLGNICRSPMAEGILRQKIEERNLPIDLDSCGTASYHVGDSPDIRAQQTIRKHGHDISDLRGRQFKLSDFDTFDLIYTMDENNYHDIVSLARNESDRLKVKMIMNEVYPGENIPVPDPYYGGMNGFEETYKMLDLATERILERVKKLKV
jgi:protein-tyrosine phosphatase